MTCRGPWLMSAPSGARRCGAQSRRAFWRPPVWSSRWSGLLITGGLPLPTRQGSPLRLPPPVGGVASSRWPWRRARCPLQLGGRPWEGARLRDIAEPGSGRHVPVMVEEVLDMLDVTSGLVVDATVGSGGHAAAILRRAPGCFLLGLDRDEKALEIARDVLAPFGARARVAKASFDQLASVVASQAPEGCGPVMGVLFDLGVSSMQIDDPGRGFSYVHSGPLDMRADQGQSLTAGEVVNDWPEEALEELFRRNGEAEFARRLAAAVVAARPLESTGALAAVVEKGVPGAARRRRRGNPAKRVFQAIRRAVNGEEESLVAGLEQAVAIMNGGGRCVVVAYHSGEDGTVKSFFRNAASGGCTCPPGLPCGCGAVETLRVIKRGALKPTQDEVNRNPRAASARLRAAERINREGAGR